MQVSDALDDVLASRGHLRILRALDALPEGLGVSARDLARRAEVAHNRASEVLNDFTGLGLTRVQRAGRADLYQLNRRHVLYEAVHELFGQEAQVQAELVDNLDTVIPQPVVPAVGAHGLLDPLTDLIAHGRLGQAASMSAGHASRTLATEAIPGRRGRLF